MNCSEISKKNLKRGYKWAKKTGVSKRSCLGLGKDSISFQEATRSLENIKRKYFDFLRKFSSEIKRNDKIGTKALGDRLSPNVFRHSTWQKIKHGTRRKPAKLPGCSSGDLLVLNRSDALLLRTSTTTQQDKRAPKELSLTSHSHCCFGVFRLLHVGFRVISISHTKQVFRKESSYHCKNQSKGRRLPKCNSALNCALLLLFLYVHRLMSYR